MLKTTLAGGFWFSSGARCGLIAPALSQFDLQGSSMLQNRKRLIFVLLVAAVIAAVALNNYLWGDAE
jgi:hypothetical protein